MKLSNLLNKEAPLWKRIWLSIVIIFAIGFGGYGVLDAIDNNYSIVEILFPLALIITIFAAVLFVIVRLFKWVKDGMGEIKLGAFAKIILSQIIAVIFLLIFYFIASPYQNCIRQNLAKNFCIKATRW